MDEKRIDVADIVRDDEFWHEGQKLWTAKAKAIVVGDFVRVRVQHFPDGGFGVREWPVGKKVTIRRG